MKHLRLAAAWGLFAYALTVTITRTLSTLWGWILGTIR